MTKRAIFAALLLTFALAATPVAAAPPGALGNVVAFHTGFEQACAVISDGTARCWGYNQYGQLGDGTFERQRLLPVVVKDRFGTGTLTGVRQVDLSIHHTCAAMVEGTAMCWGQNWAGQLGDGTTQDTALPVFVKLPSGLGDLVEVAQITTTEHSSCALITDGTARCWGFNDDGQLGNGTFEASHLPVVVQNELGTGPLTGITQIAAGAFHVCALLADRTVRCWGDNTARTLGDGTYDDSALPLAVKGADGRGRLSGVAQIDVGGFTSCTRMVDGTARCWGENTWGQAGNGTRSRSSLLFPTVVQNSSGTGPLTGVAQIAVGEIHTCAVVTDSTALCWGSNVFGEIGNGKITQNEFLPEPVVANRRTGALANRMKAISAGLFHTCASVTNGTVVCWGLNDAGQLGDGTITNRLLPAAVHSG